MTLPELISHRLIIEAPIQEPPHVVAYDYERVFLDGILDTLVFRPLKVILPNTIIIQRKDEDLMIKQGVPYIVSLVILYHVLAVRLNISCDYPYIVFKANRFTPLHGINDEQLESFLLDIRAINMHNVELTNGYYKRLIDSMTELQSETLFQKLNTIII